MPITRNPINQKFFDFLNSPDFRSVMELSGGEEVLESWNKDPRASKEKDAATLTKEEIARFESCQPMAEHIVQKCLDRSHGGKLYGREDLVQVALMALAKASVEFDAERGIKFSSMAYLYMQNAVTSALRKEYNRREFETSSLNTPNEDGDEMVDTVTYQHACDPVSDAQRAELREMLLRQISLLTENERKVVMMYMEGHTIMSICGANVVPNPKNTFASAMQKLREALHQEESLCLS
jgi:RNA polymerase sigma factor (sigma-70 family)